MNGRLFFGCPVVAALLFSACSGGSGSRAVPTVTQPPVQAIATPVPPASPVPLTANDWPQYGRDVQRSGNNTEQSTITAANVATLKPKWIAQIPSGGFASPVVANDKIYTADMFGHITEVDADTGAIGWVATVSDTFVSTPAIYKGVLYEGTYAGRFYAFDANNGALLRTYPVPSPHGSYESSPLAANGLITIGRSNHDETTSCISDHQVIQFSTTSATIAHYMNLTAIGDNGVGVWSSPALGPDGAMYLATGNSCALESSPNADAILKVNIATLRIEWAFHGPPEGPAEDMDFGATPVFISGMVVDGAKNGIVYAVNQSTGAAEWSTNAEIQNGEIIGSLTTDGQRIYVPFTIAPTGGAIVALSPQGSVLWSMPTAISSDPFDTTGVLSKPTVANGVVYVGYRDLTCANSSGSDCTGVSALDAPTGKVLWRYTTQGNIWSSPTVIDDGLLVFDIDTGQLYCFTPNGV
jgi:outer membrane protein assembly factor BamB